MCGIIEEHSLLLFIHFSKQHGEEKPRGVDLHERGEEEEKAENSRGSKKKRDGILVEKGKV